MKNIDGIVATYVLCCSFMLLHASAKGLDSLRFTWVLLTANHCVNAIHGNFGLPSVFPETFIVISYASSGT